MAEELTALVGLRDPQLSGMVARRCLTAGYTPQIADTGEHLVRLAGERQYNLYVVGGNWQPPATIPLDIDQIDVTTCEAVYRTCQKRIEGEEAFFRAFSSNGNVVEALRKKGIEAEVTSPDTLRKFIEQATKLQNSEQP